MFMIEIINHPNKKTIFSMFQEISSQTENCVYTPYTLMSTKCLYCKWHLVHILINHLVQLLKFLKAECKLTVCKHFTFKSYFNYLLAFWVDLNIYFPTLLFIYLLTASLLNIICQYFNDSTLIWWNSTNLIDLTNWILRSSLGLVCFTKSWQVQQNNGFFCHFGGGACIAIYGTEKKINLHVMIKVIHFGLFYTSIFKYS